MSDPSDPNGASSFAPAQGGIGRLAEVHQPSQRPEPGLARGRWEAPAGLFWAVALVTAAVALTWGGLTLWRVLPRRGRRVGRRNR